MSVLKIILATILILCLFGVSCDKSKAQKDEVKSENKLVHKMLNNNIVQFKNNKLVLDKQIIKIKRIFILRDPRNNVTDLAIQYKVKSKSDKYSVTVKNSWEKGFRVLQNDKPLGMRKNTKHLYHYRKWLTKNDEKIEKGETRKGMVIYHLNNAQKVVLQAKRGYEGKILAEQDYPISELKTVDLNQLSNR